MVESHGKPLFILSFRQRDELAAATTRGGWRPVAARRSEGAARRLVASGAAVAVIDARGALDEGLAATRMLGEAVAADGRALLVLVSHNDAAALPEFRAAGATHFLVSPMREVELQEAIRFAERHAQRASGGWITETQPSEPLAWRYDHARRSLQLSPALAASLEAPADASVSQMLRRVREDRPLLAAALRRLEQRESATFAHDLPGVGRVVEHIQRDPRTGRLHALIEPLGETPDASAEMRDVFPRRSRSLATLAEELPRAFAEHEIDVLFQPQVVCATGQIVGVEALARWHHPRLGEIGAEALIAAAARAGQGPVLSGYLQNRALGAAAGWAGALARLKLSINVTAEDLAAPGFGATMLERIAAHGIAPERVTVEVTESGLIESLESATEALEMLRGAGCLIAIDDFGTGYSSLAYLNALPLDVLKLDKRMTQQMVSSPRERIVVRGVIGMARSLGLSVVAEGVETREQLDRVIAEGCDLYQGYLCAPAVDSARLAELVGA
ncbi:EAL domain-containing protein [Sphingomonas cannabina]|uniref:EAL domain-containing protein n=1 Tax=Sphingomonas cannabina TaxID=2899123 RepID=UPI001F3F1270|nr:EAL domain-containing protein [Sphingomonas cannabina]UIJ43525.1 EAL domain-containing protein [Sphingomonas cannabina]